MVTKGLNKITQNETQELQLVDNFCKSWDETQALQLVDNFCKSWDETQALQLVAQILPTSIHNKDKIPSK